MICAARLATLGFKIVRHSWRPLRYDSVQRELPCSSSTACTTFGLSASLFAMTTASTARSPVVPCRSALSTPGIFSGFLCCRLDSTNAGSAPLAAACLTFTQAPAVDSNGLASSFCYCWRQFCGLTNLRRTTLCLVGWFVLAHPSARSSPSFISCARPRTLCSKRSSPGSLLPLTPSVPSAARPFFLSSQCSCPTCGVLRAW